MWDADLVSEVGSTFGDDDDDGVAGIWDAIAGLTGAGADVMVAREQRRAINAGGDAASLLAMRRGGRGPSDSVSAVNFGAGGGWGPLAIMGALGLGMVLILRK